MKAGRTKIDMGTRIRTTTQWGGIVTGYITHPFGSFGINPSTLAGIVIDEEYHAQFGDKGNLYEGDFELLKKEMED